jgi:hypothetical protein
LHDIQPISEIWPKAGQCPSIDGVFTMPNLTFTTVNKEGDILEVNAAVGGQDIGVILIKEGVAKRSRTPDPNDEYPELPLHKRHKTGTWF